MAESLKFARFVDALRALCAAHEVIVAVSGYDALQVWNAREGEDCLECNGLEDCTGLSLAPRDEKDYW
jgi:hypothetical protein